MAPVGAGLTLALTVCCCSAQPVMADPRRGATEVAPGPEAADERDRKVPVVYAQYLNPDPLADERVARLSTAARESLTPRRDVWFVLVCTSRRGKSYSAVVFLVPDSVDGRLRKGQAVRLDNDPPLPGADKLTFDYVHVARPDDTAPAEAQGVPPPVPRTPHNTQGR